MGLTSIVDRNQTDDNDNSKVVITGGDDQHIADVVDENGVKKLVVKASATSAPLGNIFFEKAENGGSSDLTVDGSVTPVEFTIPADATEDKVVSALAFRAVASGITIDKFLSLNNPLTNGILIEVKSDDTIFQFEPILTTQDFDFEFAYGPGRSFDIIFASGNDSLVARFGPQNPFTIRSQGTFASDDYIKVIIRDNLSAIANIEFIAFGEQV